MKFLIMTFFAFFSLQRGLAQQGQLTIQVTNIKELKGQLVVAIFDKKENFPQKGKAFRTVVTKINASTMSCILDNIPYGHYSVALYQDKNWDGQCNLNFWGIPTEGYGFSNNVKPKLSAPSFEDTRFKFLLSDKLILINLIQ